MRQDIGELLVENGQITDEELKNALKEVEKIAEPTGRVLLRLGLVNEDNLKTVLELNYGVNYVDLKKMEPAETIFSILPEDLVFKYDVLPIQEMGNRLTLAMVTPTDNEALGAVKEHLKDKQLNIVVCSDDGFEDFVSRAYPKHQVSQGRENQDEFIDLIGDTESEIILFEELLKTGSNENKAVILLSHHIISNAINKGCTNIHIEPNDRQVLVHYRKEGVLFPARKLPKSVLPDLVQSFKTMAAKIAEGMVLPYDGLLKLRHGQRQFSFRLSIVPGAFGEHLIIWLE